MLPYPDSNNGPSPAQLREMLQVAHEVRARLIDSNRKLRQRDVYALCFHLAQELRAQFPDIRIMVGDRAVEHGFAQHLWLEIPSGAVFVDPAFDAIDPFQLVRVGRTTESDFAALYHAGQDGNFDLDDPRNRPGELFRTRTAWDGEV